MYDLHGILKIFRGVWLLIFRQLNIKKVLVSGGSLDHRVVPQILNEGGGEKVAILALDEAGRVSWCGNAYYSEFYVRQSCHWGQNLCRNLQTLETSEYILGSYLLLL